MKTIKVILLLATIALSKDYWWYPRERYQPAAHFTLSAAFSAGTYYTWQWLFPSSGEKGRARTLWWSVPIGVAPGFAKEFLLDREKNKFFNLEDMYYNMYGSWTGATIIWILQF